MEFDLDESLKQYMSDPASISTPEANIEVADLDKDNVDQTVVTDALEAIRESIHENPDTILQGNALDTIQCVLK